MRTLRSMDRRLRTANRDNGDPNVRTLAKLFKCSMCSKDYLHKTTLSYHMRYAHRGGQKTNPHGRQNHSDQNIGVSETRLLLYKCTYCVAVFKGEILRNRHLLKMHSGRNIFACLLCKSSFNKKVSLKWHRYVHHPNQKYPKVGRIPSASTPVKPSTSASVTSPRVRSTKSKLGKKKIAKRTKNELPCVKTKNGVEYAYANQFTCLYCPKSLSCAYAKEIHERRHNGKRPFPCKFCELSSETWNQHKKHERECKYLHAMAFCKFCDFHTLERANLEHHYKRMHGFTFETEAEIEFLRREVLLEPEREFLPRKVLLEPQCAMSPVYERRASSSDDEDGSKNESGILESTTNEELDENVRNGDLEPSNESPKDQSLKRMSYNEFEQEFLNRTLELYSEISNESSKAEIVSKSTPVSIDESEEVIQDRCLEPNEIVSISKPISNNETDFQDGSLVPYSETSNESSTAEIGPDSKPNSSNESEKSFQDRTLEPNSESSNELSKPIPSEEFEKAFREIISEPSEQNDQTEVSINVQQSDHDAEAISQVNDKLEKMFQDEISSPKVEPHKNTAASDVTSNDQLVAELEDNVSNQCLEDSPKSNLEAERNVDCPKSNLEAERNVDCPKRNLEAERTIDSESIVQPSKAQSKNPVDEKYIKYEIEVAQLDNKLKEIFQSNEVTESSATAEDEVEPSTPRRIIDLTEEAESGDDEIECTSGPVFLIDDD